MAPASTVENRIVFEYAFGVAFVVILFTGFLSRAFPGPHVVDGLGTAVVVALGPVLLSAVFAALVGLGVDRLLFETWPRFPRTDDRRTR
ncbi:hypothetical protein [Natronorarus salvus]|uniref:hypothetical protein n=1 Tax=Natronorarus salvus TaxID=3117733 RepID=UPI002F266143